MADNTQTTVTPQQALAWESANRQKAAIAAWAAGLLALGGGILTSISYSSLPDFNDRVVTINDALGDLAAGRPIPAGRAAAQVLWIADHPAGLLVGAILSSLAAFLIFGVLAYLFKATKARNPGFAQISLILGAIGAVTYGVGSGVVGVGRVVGASGFAQDGTNAAAVKALSSSPVLVGTILQQLGAFALGFAFVMICLNAMRVGLLSRFMGILGIIVGGTFVLPVDQQGIIRSFWLVAVGFLIARRWPGSVPAAWETGEAVPWVSTSKIRGPAGPPQTVPETPAPTPPPQLDSGQRRKKRKKK